MNKVSRLLLIASVFVGLSANASDFFGGDIPTGDTIVGNAFITLSNGDNTIVTDTGNGGLFQGYAWFAAGSGAQVNNTKFTIDGGSEKTLGTSIQLGSGGGADYMHGFIPIGVKFRTSLVVKVNKAAVAATTIRVCPVYNIKP